MPKNNEGTTWAAFGAFRAIALSLSIPALVASTVLVPAALTTSSAQAATADPGAALSQRAFYPQLYSGGGVTVAGTKWLGGKGVSVYRSRGCGELPARLYAVKGWGRIQIGYAGAKTIGRYSLGVTFHRNGSGYVPVPGDVVVEGNSSFGHVAVVDRVTRGKIVTVEENGNASGWHIYSWRGKHASGAYGGNQVTGFVHSPKNTSTNP
ncbi:MAG: CHAP domain-containing protein [Actinomycetes bacterium]